MERDPPLNVALKNLCEAYLLERTERLSAGPVALCSQHSERLFCLDSETHQQHIVRPINEGAPQYREILREILEPLQKRLELFNDIKINFDQTAKDIEVQAQDTERQIKDVFLTLQKLLKEEKQARIGAVRKEERQKSQTMKRKSEALSRDIAALSNTVRATEEVLRAEDLSFLQGYRSAAQTAQHSLPDVPQPTPGGLIDMDKHLNNLSYETLDSMKKKVTSTQNPRTAETAVVSLGLSRLFGRQRRSSPREALPWRRPLFSRQTHSDFQ